MRACRNLRRPRPHLSLQVSARCRTQELSRTGRSHILTSRALFFFERTACRLFRGRRFSNLLRWTRRRRVKPFGSGWLPLRPRLKPKEKSLACPSMSDSFVRFIVFCRTLQEWHTARWAIEEDEKCWYHRERTFLYTHLSRGRGDAHRTALVHKTRWQSHSTKFLKLCLSWLQRRRVMTRQGALVKRTRKKTKLGEGRGFVQTFEPMWATRLEKTVKF